MKIYENMWDYAQEQRYTDVTVIEKLEHSPENHIPREYPAHRLVLSTNCEYFKTQFQSNFNDATAPEIHVYGNHQYPGVLGTILEALYAETHITKEIYEDFVTDNAKNLDKCIAAFNVCGFLMLTEHMNYIEANIKKTFTESDILEWWTDHPISDTYVPIFVKTYLCEMTYGILSYLNKDHHSIFLKVLETEETLQFFKDIIKESITE